jgi:hypothetical protein
MYFKVSVPICLSHIMLPQSMLHVLYLSCTWFSDFHHQNVDGADIMFSKQTAYTEVECWHGSTTIPVGFLVYIYSLCEFCTTNFLKSYHHPDDESGLGQSDWTIPYGCQLEKTVLSLLVGTPYSSDAGFKCYSRNHLSSLRYFMISPQPFWEKLGYKTCC